MSASTDGGSLRAIRERRHLTQWEVAREMGVTGSRISQIENQLRVTDRLEERYMVALRHARMRREGRVSA